MKMNNKYKLVINRGNGWEPHPAIQCAYSEHDANELIKVSKFIARKESSAYYGWKFKKVKVEE